SRTSSAASGKPRPDDGDDLANLGTCSAGPTPLRSEELELLAAATKGARGRNASLDISSARTWEDVRRILQQSSHETLAEVLRAHRLRVQAETRAERVE
ncbi:unnamed protein product, partial [Symbiodinium pilosum]